MANENVNLEWENHNQLIAATFKRLYEDETLTDVTVYCKDGPLRAHKLVMSICSPYFSKIYQMNPGLHMVVMVNGVTMKEMQLLLEFMYKGNVTIPAENYERVAQVAEQLEMKDFRKLKIESETERKFPQNFLNDDKLKTKTKIDVNKIVADYPDVSVKTKCQTDVEEEESDESHDEEPKIVTSQPQKINLACKICKKTFQKVKQLTLHVKSHSGKKPYVCNFCPAGFKRSSHLTRHKLIHTGEKPHSCTACDKSFSRLDKLKQHNRNTHNNDNIRTKRPLEEEVSGSRKRQKGRPRKFSDEKEANYDITNLPFGDLSYLTMPDPAMNPMEPLVEIKTSETAGSLKLKDTPRAEIKTEGSLVKIGECIVSMTGNNT